MVRRTTCPLKRFLSRGYYLQKSGLCRTLSVFHLLALAAVMMHFNPTTVFIATVLVLSQRIVAEEAHALEVFPELKNSGPVDIAYIDPNTRKAIHERIDEK